MIMMAIEGKEEMNEQKHARVRSATSDGVGNDRSEMHALDLFIYLIN